jgi:hypothetical protein
MQLKLLLYLDATSTRIVAEEIRGVKLAAGAALMMFGLAISGKLHDKHGDRRQQKRVNHAAFLQKNAQNKPGKKKSRRYKPEFHKYLRSNSQCLVDTLHVLSTIRPRAGQRRKHSPYSQPS